MVYDPSKRLTAQEVLYHYYFSELREPKTLQHLAKQYHLPKLLKCH